MNEFVRYFIFLQVSVQLLSVASYTVVLKQVKTVHPSVKVYRYDLRQSKLLPEANAQYIYHKPLLGQRIYPVALALGKDPAFKPRFPPKKEKLRLLKAGEKPALRDPRPLGLPQHLVPPVSNQIEEYSEAKEEEEEGRPLASSLGVPSLGKSFTSFGQEKGRVHGAPGEWATPAPQADAENTTKAEFTPSQLYLQIRHKNTVIHVPQSEALKDAETLEELINAPRLKELARTTHVQETYSEEGYEDAAYDHAGHIRQAQHGEVYDAKDEGKFRIKEPPVIIDYDSDLEESKGVPSRDLNGSEKSSAGENVSNKLEPRITRSRAEVSKTSLEYAKTPKNYKGDRKYSSRIKGSLKGFEDNGNPFNATTAKEVKGLQPTFPTYFRETPPLLTTTLPNHSAFHFKPPNEKSSKLAIKDLNSTQIYPLTESPNAYTDFNPYISQIDSQADSQASPSTKSLKYSRIYSKKTKQLRLEPYKGEDILSPPPPPSPSGDLQPPSIGNSTAEDDINQRIVLPTIGYINSLTTAHFGKDSSKSPEEESKSQLTDALNLTQALDYLRSNKNQKTQETTKNPAEIDIHAFEPMKLKKSRPPVRGFVKKSKRDVYLVKMRGRRSQEGGKEEYEGNDESDAPHDEKNEEIAEDERKRIEAENLEKEKYEADLREEITNQEKEILKETYRNIGVEEDISEVFPELPSSDSEPDFSSLPEETTPTPVNTRKYPFYLSRRLPENSPLRYATDPQQFPRKSGYAMEFYESRERLIQCPDFHPDLGDLPTSNSTEYSEEQGGENQRLAGLGDKIACLRMKYFDPEPFDNPIFKEKEINYVGKGKYRKRNGKAGAKGSRGKDGNSQESAHRKSSAKNKQKGILFNRNHIIPQETRTNPISLDSAHPTNRTETHRVIPVTETLSDVPPHPPGAPSSPPIFWKTTYRSKPSSQSYLKPPDRTKTPNHLRKLPKVLILPYSCLHNISRLTLLDGKKNLTIDCRDATLMQEVVGTFARLRIIPKEKNEKKQTKKKWSEPVVGDGSDWVPIVGRTPAQVSRRTDEVTKLGNETNHNSSSNHYVIDELKEEENVRKGEVVDDMEHYMKLMEEAKGAEGETTTESGRRRREAEGGSVEGGGEGGGGFKLRPKRPLARLSGIDFLVKYHKNKGKGTTEKTEDFWRVTSRPQRKLTETEKPLRAAPKATESTAVHSAAEATTKTVGVREKSSSQQTNASGEKTSKFRVKQTEPRKISPLNLIPERVTKRPEARSPELRKAPVSPVSSGKIVTKVSREVSESSEKPRVVVKMAASTTQSPPRESLETSPSAKPELREYKTINRNSNQSSSEPKQLSKSTDYPEGPILYYVVNLKTGRGKWITDYEERRRGGPGKYKQAQKGKESSGGKGEKRRGKHKY